MFGQLLPVAEPLLQFAEIMRFTVVGRASGDQPFRRGTWGQTAFLFGCGRAHFFYSWSWYYATHYKSVVVVVSCGHRSNLAAISTTVGSTVPL